MLERAVHIMLVWTLIVNVSAQESNKVTFNILEMDKEISAPALYYAK